MTPVAVTANRNADQGGVFRWLGAWRSRPLGRLPLLVALAMGAVVPARAALPARTGANQSYLIDAWETDQGLPENSTRQMVQTPDGYLWFGTLAGLVRFDGIRFDVFTRANTPSLPSDGIVYLHLDGAQRLWVSTLRGLVVSEPGRWTSFKLERRWTGDYVRTLAERAGVMCLTSFDGKIFRVSADAWQELPKPPGLEGKTYFSHVDRGGGISVIQAGFYGHWDGGRWVESTIAPVVAENFRGAGPSRDGNLLVYSTTELLRLDGNIVLSRLPLTEALPAAWQVVEDREGKVWLPTWGSGIFVIAPDGVIQRFSTANGLLSDLARFVFEDREGNRWVGGGNGGGLIRMKSRTVVTFGLEAGLSERLVKAVAETPAGEILLGTYGGKGIARMVNGRAVPWGSATVNASGLFVQCLLVDRQGVLWAGTYAKGLLGFEDESRAPTAFTASGNNINALFEDSRGRLWVGGSTTTAVRAGGEFTLQAQAAGTPLPHVLAFAETAGDRVIWAANENGLFRHIDGAWREVHDAQGNPLKEIHCLRADADGTLWVGGGGVGLLRWRAGRWSAIGEEHGLPTKVITCMVDDGAGWWWFGSNRGLMRVPRQDLDLAADGVRAKLPFQVFNVSDGLPTLECVSGLSTTALRDRRGRLWFATPRGAAMVDARHLRVNDVAPTLLLESVAYVDGREKKHVLRPDPGKTVVLPPGSRKLEAQYAVLSYSAPEKVVLQHRFERDGQLISEERQSGRTFQSDLLVPGDYALAMQAANNDGLWRAPGVILRVSVEPFAWETGWFRGLLLLGLTGGAGLVSWRVARSRQRRQWEQLEQERVLAAERARLAAVLEATSDLVSFADPQGRVLFLNAAGRKLLGIGPGEDVRQFSFREFHPPEVAAHLEHEVLPLARRDGLWSGESVLRTRAGAELAVSQVMVAHRDAAGALDFLSTIARDITGRKQAEAAMRQLNTTLDQRVQERTAELERANRELEAFAYSVSHDLRAPLRNITGFLELLAQRTAGRLDAEETRLFATVSREAVRLATLIDKLLAFARIGRVELELAPVPLAELVAEVRQELAAEAGGAAVEWRVAPLPVVLGDRTLLRQVLANLLGNAVKFARDRTPPVIEIGETVNADPALATLFVRDNGAGFNAKYQEKLFGVFQRLHSVREFEGLGIGLAMVRRIVERHGGKIWAEGEVNRGATFSFTLRRGPGDCRRSS